MERNSKFSLTVISLIFAYIVISIFLQEIRTIFDGPILSLILGSAPSFLYTLGMLLICFLLVKKEPEKNSVYVTLGLVAYKVRQSKSSRQRAFDYIDSLIVMAFIFFTLFIKKSDYLMYLKESEINK
jgi:magnesium-transporting ATPase (P-type)